MESERTIVYICDGQIVFYFKILDPDQKLKLVDKKIYFFYLFHIYESMTNRK